MNTAKEIVKAVGMEAIKARFGVKDRVVRLHVAKGELPAQWFAALCQMTGQELDRGLFSFKGMDVTND